MFSWGRVVKSNPGMYCELHTEVDTDAVEEAGRELQNESSTDAAIYRSSWVLTRSSVSERRGHSAPAGSWLHANLTGPWWANGCRWKFVDAVLVHTLATACTCASTHQDCVFDLASVRYSFLSWTRRWVVVIIWLERHFTLLLVCTQVVWRGGSPQLRLRGADKLSITGIPTLSDKEIV